MSCFGIGLAFFEVVLTSLFGVTTTFVFIWISLPLSSGLFSLAAVHNQFVHAQPVLVYVIQLFMSASNAVMIMLLRKVLVGVLPKSLLGTMVAVVGVAISLGKIVYAGIMQWVSHDNLANFFLLLSVVFVVLLTLLYPLLYPVARRQEENFECGPEQESKSTLDPTETVSVKVMLQSRFFHMIFWTCTLNTSAAYTILNNITSITTSIGIKDPFAIVTTMSLCIIVIRLLFGLLFDKHPSQKFAIWLLLSVHLSFTGGMAIGLWFLNSTTVYLMGMLCATAVGQAYVLPVTILVYEYGRYNLNQVFAAYCAVSAVSQLLMQMMTGYLYDRNVTVGTTCEGTGCFYWLFFFLFCLAIIISVVQCINYVMTVQTPAKT